MIHLESCHYFPNNQTESVSLFLWQINDLTCFSDYVDHNYVLEPHEENGTGKSRFLFARKLNLHTSMRL